MKLSDFLPILGVISGLFALFVDREKSKHWTALALFGIVMAAAISIGANLYDEKRDERKNEAAHSEDRAHLDQEFQQLRVTILAQAGARTDTVAAASNEELDSAVEAVQLKQKLVSSIPESQREGLRILYFPHFKQDVNPTAMIAALRQITSDVGEKSGNVAVSELPTNCVWVGDQVTAEEGRAVALALAGAGISVRDLRQLKEGSGAHARLIEIGASAKVQNLPALSPKQLATQRVRLRTDPGY